MSYLAIHPRALLRDDLSRGRRPQALLNIPAGSKVEGLTPAEFSFLGKLTVPQPLEETLTAYAELKQLSRSAARERFFQRFIDKELVSLRESESSGPPASRQEHLHIPFTLGAPQRPARTPLHVYLELTQACNLKCFHCFSTAGGRLAVMPLELVKDLLAQMDRLGVMSLTLSGGEPTLHPGFPAILDLVAHSRMGFVLLTNATRFQDREFLDRIIYYSHHVNREMTLGISYDGISPETHDKVRGVAGSLELTRGAIEYLTQNGFSKISLQMMMCRHNLHEVEAVADWAAARGLKRLILFDLLPLGQGVNCQEHLPTPAQEQWLLATALRLQARYRDRLQIRLPHYVRHFAQILSTGREESHPHRCLAGMEEMAIRADGLAYPCSYIWNEEFCLGSVSDQTILELWQSEKMNFFRGGYTVADLRECSHCRVRLRCNIRDCRAIPIMLGDKLGPWPRCWKFNQVFQGVGDDAPRPQ